METAKRKHILYDHPFLGGLVAMFLSYMFIANFGAIPELSLQIAGDLFPDTAISAEMASLIRNVGSIVFVIFALLCLLIHRLWFRKDGYRGCFTRPGLRNREAWLFVLLGLLLDIVLTAANAVEKGTMPLMPTVSTALISLQAGTFEETTFRGVPVSIMMRNNPSRRRMWAAAIITAAVFGIVHMGNMTAGAALTAAIVQSANAFCMGLLFAAIYLRSGNILLTMVFHTLHDVIALTDPEQVTGVYTTVSFSTKDLVILAAAAAAYAAAGIFLLRKSKWEEIRSTWANIWAE